MLHAPTYAPGTLHDRKAILQTLRDVSGPVERKMGNVGALIIRIGLVGILCYKYNKEASKPYSNY